jgi:hypothetical protein
MTTRWRVWSSGAAVAAILMTATPWAIRRDAQASPTLHTAQTMFYNGRYAEAAAAIGDLCTAAVDALPACEVRSSAILFQLRRAIGDPSDKDKAFKQCAECGALFTTFVADIRQAQGVARVYLKAHPDDDETLFFLGKLDLNYVWLQLGTLGRKTGWDEYWEARRSLDAVLKRNPRHVRAKVARAWVDYIVDTKMPRMTKWLLGGGSKKRGLQAVREAADAETDLFIRAEAVFALWDMQVRERNIIEAVKTARRLAADFPENADVRKFLETHAAQVAAVPGV